MVTRTAWLNREKLAFAVSALALAAVAVYAVGSRPVVGDPGEHRAGRPVPRQLGLFLEEPGDLSALLAGGRANPFESVGPGSGAPVDHGKKGDAKPKAKDTIPEGLFIPVKKDEVDKAKPTRLPVPVNFVAVVRTAGGDLCVGLRDKKTREIRRLAEGDVWPEINLRILEISVSSVLLENSRGERFEMLDLYGRRASGRDPGAVDGAGRD